MVMIVILYVPLTIGGMWGFWQARSHRFSFAVLQTAPLVSAALIGVAFVISNMLYPPDGVVARPAGDRIFIHLSTGCLYGAMFGFYGAVPALVGSAGTQLFMLWAGARPASNRKEKETS